MEEKLLLLKEKIEADSSLGEKLFNLETEEEVQSFLKDQGLDFTLEEISVLRKAVIKTQEKGELSDEDLEEVAGGIVVTTSVVATTAAVVGATASVGAMVHNVSNRRW